MDNSPSFALVTGASSGIGREYAVQLSTCRGYSVIAIARRLDRLEELRAEVERHFAGTHGSSNRVPEIICIQADLSTGEGREKALQQVDQLGKPIRLLINNAGFGSVSFIEESTPERQVEMVELNCAAPVHFTCHFLPKMYAQGFGQIVNLCSTAAFQPMPYMATYAATKSFLLSFSFGIGAEAARHGVRVLAQCPGPTETEFHIASGLPEKISILRAQSCAEVVREALNAMDQHRPIVVHGLLNRCISFLPRLLPLSLSAKLVRGILRAHAERDARLRHDAP